VTYSIVARDPDSGQLGVAVQSKYFSVGSVVPWAQPGVGAVATQSFAEAAYGPRGLELMASGVPAAEALAQLVAEDELRDRRQVGVVDGQGNAAAHTGERCIAEAGQHVGTGFTCQANLMLKPTVWDAMADAYQATPGDLAERLLAALDAAELEGGDVRGRQSVALLVVSGDRQEPRWKHQIDLRVEDHSEPLVEMRRLLQLRRAFDAIDTAEKAMVEGDGESPVLRAIDELNVDDSNIQFMKALALATAGDFQGARAIIERLSNTEPGWPLVARRFHEAEVATLSPEVLEALSPPVPD
jgi:uncharacterized Ntn-hydrolase superfamily protein